MKLLFLDVDGVLNHTACDWTTDALHALDLACVARVKRIVQETSAQIVLSSTWRLSDAGCARLLEVLAPIPILRATPVIREGLYREADRRVEIAQVIDEEQTSRWAVLDDDTDADLADGSFFRTNFEGGGLTDTIAYQVIDYLNRDDAYDTK